MKPLASPLAALVLIAAVATVRAEVQTKALDYKVGDATYEGYLAWNDAFKTPRPAVLVVHDWNGLDDYEKLRARMLAELGYVALAVDVYGKGVRPTNTQESSAEARKLYGNLPEFRARLQAAVTVARSLPEVDKTKVAAIGYCFGGAGVLELARSGSDVQGVVSFHGSLGTSMPAKEGEVKTKVMVCHAAQDPAAPRPTLVAFLDEMRDAKVDYQMVMYNVAAHPWTVIGGPQYHPEADRRSWAAMRAFLDEVFKS
ncbi:MAG: dienelactone hydrolase family protein [Fimbriimonadaceae bacterium]|nr:dienelactone hydrolase family protein [Fimbriimonadaceae bacterium]